MFPVFCCPPLPSFFFFFHFTFHLLPFFIWWARGCNGGVFQLGLLQNESPIVSVQQTLWIGLPSWRRGYLTVIGENYFPSKGECHTLDVINYMHYDSRCFSMIPSQFSNTVSASGSQGARHGWPYAFLSYRCSGGGLWGTETLVLHCLLRAQQPRGRSVPCLLHERVGGRFHRSFQQQEPFLSWAAIQR